jgi:hypothetical protein
MRRADLYLKFGRRGHKETSKSRHCKIVWQLALFEFVMLDRRGGTSGAEVIHDAPLVAQRLGPPFAQILDIVAAIRGSLF